MRIDGREAGVEVSPLMPWIKFVEGIAATDIHIKQTLHPSMLTLERRDYTNEWMIAGE